MSDYLELEIGLSRRDADRYIVELRFSDPEGEVHPTQRGTVHFPWDDLRRSQVSANDYGALLTKSLFADGASAQYFALARKEAQERNKNLRLRLQVDDSAPELHNLRWETLRDLESDSWLLLQEQVLFSRLVPSRNWERVTLRAKGEIKALVAIANPRDLADDVYKVDGQALRPIDVQGELERSVASLAGMAIDTLTSDAEKGVCVTLNRVVEALRQGVDILYLVCHGAMLSRADPPGAYILLEKEDGMGDLVAGAWLADRILALPAEARPRLVVLASCQSAGVGDAQFTSDAQGALAALGPQLARVGVPAVVAMQGSVSMQTVAEMMPVFFREMLSHGMVDQAIAVARGQVNRRADAWMPVVFMRLRDGRVWYEPGFARSGPEFLRWPGLITGLKTRKCTPILGPGLDEYLTGQPGRMARQWAEEFGFPLSEEERDQLPQVAQYLANVQGSRDVPRVKLVEHLEKAIRQRYRLTPAEAPIAGVGQLNWLAPDLQERIGKQMLADSQSCTYAVMANLPAPVYITTNPDILLDAALRAVGKAPVVEYCRWNADLQALDSNLPQEETVYQPSVARPLVYHLFGLMSEPSSLVISEDDYFEFLTWINQYGAQNLSMVSRAWSVNALLLLGFNLYAWNFRILFRSIPLQERLARRDTQPSVAVQVSPGEDQLQPERARQYLEQYFMGVKMGMYWGSMGDFCNELKQRSEKEGLYGLTA
jgi:hypothetical protein